MGQFTIFYMQPIIELEKVTKRFGGITALNNASLKVNKGEVVGLIGDNGAGKSTLIKTLVGVHSPDDGDIKIRGDKVNNWNALKAREAGIAGIDVILVTDKFINQNRELVEKFIEVTDAANENYKKGKSNLKIIAKDAGMKVSDAKATMSGFSFLSSAEQQFYLSRE